MEEKKKYSLKELEQNIDLDEFTKDWCSDIGLSLEDMCRKYNGTQSNILRYIRNHKLIRSKVYLNNKRKQTNLEKYGVENPFANKEVQEKIKQTNFEKYGVKYISQSEEIRNKVKQTNFEKYGVKYISQSEEIRNKVKQTNLEKYGVENPFQNEEIRNKIKQTNLEKYGVEHASQNKEIKEKVKQTNLEKYGVENPFQNEEIRNKIKQTNLEKYGVEHASQNKEIKEKVKQTNLEKYGVVSPFANKEVQEKAKQTILEKYGVLYACQADFCKNASNGMHSKPNENFAKLLDENHIEYIREFPIENRSYDFKIGKTLIEIDPCATHNSTWGIHNKIGLDSCYHKNKSDLAKQNGYICIHIFDWDDQNKIIKLIKPKTNIYARKCQLKELQDTKEYQDFINSNHIQGYCKGNSVIIGLFYNDSLVEVMSFGKPRYNKKYEYELLRLCTDSDFLVIGGAEKIFKYFVNKYNPKSIISYCDNAKFSGNIYYKLGFNIVSASTPAKHWYNVKTGQHITDNLLRQRGFDQLFGTEYGKGASNEQLMLEYGFVEIYDCSQYTFIWKK